MEIEYKKEIYRVSVECGDKFFKEHKMKGGTMDCSDYVRINDEWFVNTGGCVLEWGKVNDEQARLLEDKFIEIME
jgi:predicted RNA-binding protein